MVVTPSVYPSGGAFATMSSPSVEPAPGRLSMTTGTFQRSASFWATRRPVISVPPPGANGTIIRTGFVGYDGCAAASLLDALRNAITQSAVVAARGRIIVRSRG